MNRPFSGLNRAECVSLMKRYPLSIGIPVSYTHLTLPTIA